MSTIALQPEASGSAPPGGRTPVNRISINNAPLDVKARSMKMDKNMGKHDGVSLSVSSPTLEDTEEILDKPISFVFGLAPRTEFFYGYVHQITEEQRDSTNLNFTMALLGTTALMQTGRPRFWANKSIPSVVRDLVQANLLGYYSQGHDLLWKTLVQTEGSDWQVSQALSNRIGYALFNWNGIVICEDPRRMYNSFGPYVRLLSESNIESSERQLLEFTPTRDSEQTYEGMGVSMSYLTSDGKVGWGKQPNATSWRFTTRTPLRSQQEVDAYINAADLIVGNWHQQAIARINGDASIHPGVCVDVVTSTAIKEKKYDGKWLVTGLQHQMDNQNFQTLLTLARPSVNTPSQVLPFRHFWEGDTKGKPTMWLQEGRWMSSWSDSRVRSVV